MAVDDVQFLVENSVEDSVQLFIDSSNRNYDFYPDPSEYVVTLDQPLRNVYGINILDASIPSTMFNIEPFNNSYRFILFANPYEGPKTSSSLHDPSPQDVLEEIGSFTKLRRFLDGLMPRLLVINDAHRGQYVKDSDGIEKGSEVEAFSGVAAFLVRHVAAGVRLFRDVEAYRSDAAFVVFESRGTEYAIDKTDPLVTALRLDVRRREEDDGALTAPNALTRESDEEERLPLLPMFAIFPEAAGNSMRNGNNNNKYTLLWYTVIEVPHVATLDQYLTRGDGAAAAALITDVTVHEFRMHPANYRMQEVLDDLSRQTGDIGFVVTGQGELEPQETFKMTLMNKVQFAADMEASSARRVLGFDLHARYAEVEKGGQFRAVKYGPNKRMHMSVFDDSTARWAMTSAGILNITGEPYVRLRCPEIEDFVNGGAGFGSYYPGLIIFKLAGGGMVTHQRFDFVNLKAKKIHPIGKLSRLTFRFERSNGMPYDFKGANHQFLLAVNRWIPTPKIEYRGSVLNPEYDANFLRYQLNRFTHNEDDDVEDAFSDADGTGAKIESDDERKYDYSTDGSFEEYALDGADI